MHVDETFIRAALQEADPNVLRMALLQAASDPELEEMELVEVSARGGLQRSFALAERHHPAVRAKALHFLQNLGDEAGGTVPDEAEIRRLMEVMSGSTLSDREFAFRRQELALHDQPHAAAWHGERPDGADGFLVAIIGSGFSGLAAAVQLQRLGVPYVIYERRAELGGTWSINTYPDARVDTPSFLYQFNFEKNYPWTEYYARQSEVRGYLQHVATKYGILEHIRFGHELLAAQFDEGSSMWDLNVSDDAGGEIRVRANVVVSASGLFSTPRALEVQGVEDFEGEVVHTTQWRDGHDLRGKSVAVIGNGSTGVQLLSRVAKEADQVHVFLRTPQWICPAEQYGKPISPEHRWLLDTMPGYWNWLCYSYLVPVLNGAATQMVDRDWQRAGGSISERNDSFRTSLTDYVKTQVQGRSDLVEKLVPDYAPMARRLIVDNNWYKTLLEDHVELVTEPIERLTAAGVLTEDGRLREVDVVVAAVGFSVTKYVYPVEYRGRAGVRLESKWQVDGPRAYLGMTVPDFPNLFIMYGPNSQSRAASFVSVIEMWARYVAQSVVELVEGGHREMEVTEKAFDTFNEQLDGASQDILWEEAAPRNRNYYVNSYGRQQVNAPWLAEDYYAMTLAPEVADYTWR